MAARHARQTLIAALVSSTLGGCQAPSINLATNQPIKVDIAMRLDVYQHEAGAGNGESPAATPKPVKAESPGAGSRDREKDRAADIQVFKNSGYIGEGHDGLLVIINAPEGGKGDYVQHMVAAENSDRMAEMKSLAKKRNTPLTQIQNDQAELWRNRSFKGEWIEVRQPNGSYQWVRKQG